MNKVLGVSIAIFLFLIVLSIKQHHELSKQRIEEGVLKQKIISINDQIRLLESFETKILPKLEVSLWNLNRYLSLYSQQINKVVHLKMEEKEQLDVSERQNIKQQGISLNFKDLNSVDDNMRVLKLVASLKQNFPLDIRSMEGFDNYLTINMVLLADQGEIK